MNFEKLKNSLVDTIAEQQLKIGYRNEKVELYYPASSLRNLLEVEGDLPQLGTALQEFAQNVKAELGGLEISHKGERFRIVIPEQGSEYIHFHAKNMAFLQEFITVIASHECGFEDIRQLFCKYSDCVRVLKMENEEFDYCFYFEDGKPDAYRYCVAFEEGHAIYHRFTIEDYEEFGFREGKTI